MMEIKQVADFLSRQEGEGKLMVQLGEGTPRDVEGVRVQRDMDPKSGENSTQVILRTGIRPSKEGRERLAREKGEAERKVKEPVTK